jgi:hypothetical protein
MLLSAACSRLSIARQWDKRLTRSLLLMADLVRGDAGVSAEFAIGALRCLGLGRAATAIETCGHKLLAGIALHAASLAVAILHSLLLSRQCVRGCRDCDRQNHGEDKLFHRHPPGTERRPERPVRQCKRVSSISNRNSSAS